MKHHKIVLFFLLLSSYLLTGCGGSGSSPTYSGAAAEGHRAVDEVMKESNASAVTVALTDGEGIIWSEAFGETDRSTHKKAVPSTMFGIGSVSKTFAAIATMILVDQKKIALDEPVVTYIPQFSMLSPEYRDITVRMLLNHSSGLPGGDMRNVVSIEPYTGYAAQVMEALKYQRLKHVPGYMSVYCNDGYTMLENLVRAVSGRSFPDFVQQEILTPLGMDNTHYQTFRFADGAYAKPHEGDKPVEYSYLNLYATGGLFSTAEDMSRLARMLLNGGVYGSRRILSARSIAAMAEDQTLGSFNPLPSNSVHYGLGWDNVSSAGLDAVGLKGWQKGGNIHGYYGAVFIVAPDEKLAVTVIGASNTFSSGEAAKIAERVLLAALVARGRLTAMPAKLDKNVPLPVLAAAAEDKTAFSGYYGAASSLYHAIFAKDDTLTLQKYEAGEWKNWQPGLKLRSDGWFANDDDAITAVRFIRRAGRTYFASRAVSGAGHYSTTFMDGQLLEHKAPLSAVWQERLNEKWLPVNDAMSLAEGSSGGELLDLKTHAPLDGYVFVGSKPLSDMAPHDDNRLNGMDLLIPQVAGRDLADLAAENWEGQQWLRYGSTLYRPLSGLAAVATGRSTVILGDAGFTEWRSLPASGTISISGAADWEILGPDFSPIAYGRGAGSHRLSGSGEKYLMLLGNKGTSVSLNLTTP